MAGLHVPGIPFVELDGSTGAIAPSQILIEVPNVNAGVTLGETFTVKEVEIAH
jgi:hypothetical protein